MEFIRGICSQNKGIASYYAASGKRRACAGVSLPEVLTASCLFLLIAGLSGSIAVSAVRTNSASVSSTHKFRAASVSIDKMAREMRWCSRILWPQVSSEKLKSGYSFASDPKKTFYFVFAQKSCSGSTDLIIGYKWNSKDKTLSQILYTSSFKAKETYLDNPKYIAGQKIIGRDIEGLSVSSLAWNAHGSRAFLEVSLNAGSTLSSAQINSSEKQISAGAVLRTSFQVMGVY